MDAKQVVIRELRKHGNISRAAREVGYHRTTIINWTKKDILFKALWDIALTMGRA